MWDLIVSVPDHCLSFYFTKLMLRITFCISLDVLNFIICMFSGTVDDV